MDAATIGSALGRRRRELGIGQNDAAMLIGMSRTTFSSYERDLQRPSAEVLPALAQFLRLTIDEILVLYGTTCVEAIRPALEQFLLSDEIGSANNHSEESIDASSESEKPATNEPDAHDDSNEPIKGLSVREELKDSVSHMPTEPSVSIFANELSNGHSGSTTLENEKVKSSTKKKKKKKKHTKH